MVLSIDRWVGKVAVVTGASSGIGYAIAVALVKNGLKVVGLARRLERLEDLKKEVQSAKGQFFPKKCDITDEAQIVNAFAWIKESVGPVAVLINNAAVSVEGHISDGNYSDWRNIFDTNVLGLLTCTREAIKQMKEANIAGHIIHINSVAGHIVPPFAQVNVYPATKWGVTAITESLRIELREQKSKIRVTSLSPGLVESEMTIHNPKVTEEFLQLLKPMPILKSEDIADGVIYVLSTPAHVQVHELTIRPVGETF